MPEDTGLGLRFRAWRVRNGLKQDAVARDCKLSPTMLSKWENGREPLPLYQARRLARALDVSLEEIASTPVLTEDELAEAGLLNRGTRHAGPHLSPPSGTLGDQEVSMESRDSLVSLARYLSDRINEMTASPELREQARKHVIAAMRRAEDELPGFLQAAAGTDEAAARQR